MVPRVYVPSLDERDGTIDLPPDEAAHLQRVLRARAGTLIRLFDGRGREVVARLTLVERERVVAEIGGPVAAASEWSVRVTLAQAVLKGDKLDDVIRDAVMMGVAAIRPVITTRMDVPASALSRGGRVERWHRIAVSSAKQCGRAVVPAVHAPSPLRDVLLSAEADAVRLMLVEPAAAPDGAGSRIQGARPASAMVLVGPEGGWTDEEVALALAAGCVPMSLGPRTLRADAAALVALSVLQFAWGGMPGFGTRDSGLGK